MMIIWRLFNDPDDFVVRPWRYGWNQIAHAVIGAGLAAVVPLPLALGLPFFWEAAQLIFRNARPYDALEDVGFFWAGTLSVLNPTIAVIGVVFLLAGIARRHEQKDPHHGNVD